MITQHPFLEGEYIFVSSNRASFLQLDILQQQQNRQQAFQSSTTGETTTEGIQVTAKHVYRVDSKEWAMATTVSYCPRTDQRMAAVGCNNGWVHLMCDKIQPPQQDSGGLGSTPSASYPVDAFASSFHIIPNGISWDYSSPNLMVAASPNLIRLFDINSEKVCANEPHGALWIAEGPFNKATIQCVECVPSKPKMFVVGSETNTHAGALSVMDVRAPASDQISFGAVEGGSRKMANFNVVCQYVACHASKPYVASCGIDPKSSSTRTSCIQLWDMRNPAKPLSVIRRASGNIAQILWTGSGSDLAARLKNESTICWFDFSAVDLEMSSASSAATTTDTGDTDLGRPWRSAKEKVRIYCPSSFLHFSSLVLPSRQKEGGATQIPSLIGVSSDEELSIVCLQHAPNISFASPKRMVISFENSFVGTSTECSQEQYVNDAAARMEARLKSGLGLDPKLNLQVALKYLDKPAFSLFRYMEILEALQLPSTFPGLFAMVGSSYQIPEAARQKKISVPAASTLNFPQWVALVMAGWLKDYALPGYPTYDTKELAYRRVATFIFMKDFTSAVQLLMREAALATGQQKGTLSLLALALEVGQKETSAWENYSETLCASLDDWLAIAISFLAETLAQPLRVTSSIFHDRRIPLLDRVALATLYLKVDEQAQLFSAYFRDLLDNLSCEMFIFCGLTQDSVAYMQQYLDFTGDVQLGVCAFAKCRPQSTTTSSSSVPSSIIQPPPQVLTSSSSSSFTDVISNHWSKWNTAYRSLLNDWGFFIERAKHDVEVKLCFDTATSSSSSSILPHGVSATSLTTLSRKATLLKFDPTLGQTLRCWCGQMLHSSAAEKSSNFPAVFQQNVASQQYKQGWCPNPHCTFSDGFPRCAVCLKKMEQKSAVVVKNMWFVWCSGCHHGGHLQHMQEWFGRHKKCPVEGCPCMCQLT